MFELSLVTKIALVALPGLPLLMALTLAGALLCGLRPSETAVRRTLGVSTWFGVALALVLLRDQGSHGGHRVFDYGRLFSVGSHSAQLRLALDELSAACALLGSGLAAVVLHFSARYLHRDPGFHRYFVCFLLFTGGVQLLFLGGTFELLMIGWELVGLSSVMLIGFFQERSAPVEGARLAFGVYRICDAGLLGAVVLLHHLTGSTDLVPTGAQPLVLQHGAAPLLVGALGVCILLAAVGKSAQLPFSYWLPKAMEGPTPSSAVFYGALAVHGGAYLLLRTEPLWGAVGSLKIAITVIGLSTALYAAFLGRTRSDVKTLLAYVAMAQVGLIFAEIGLGFPRLALAHLIGHAITRTWQLLRAPSALRDWHELDLNGFNARHAPSWRLEQILPPRARAWLFRQALARGNLEDLMCAWFIAPVLRLAVYLDAVEQDFVTGLESVGSRSASESERGLTAAEISNEVIATKAKAGRSPRKTRGAV